MSIIKFQKWNPNHFFNHVLYNNSAAQDNTHQHKKCFESELEIYIWYNFLKKASPIVLFKQGNLGIESQVKHKSTQKVNTKSVLKVIDHKRKVLQVLNLKFLTWKVIWWNHFFVNIPVKSIGLKSENPNHFYNRV